MTRELRMVITILTFITLLVWSVAKGGDNQQKLQIELRIEYGSS